MIKAIVLKSKELAASPALTALNLAEYPDHSVSVRISHSSMNYKDALALTGKGPILRSFPIIPGIDLAGTVQEDRSGRFEAGDEIVATGHGLGEVHWGGYAEFGRFKPEWLLPRPPSLTAHETMAIGTAGLTAALCILALESRGVSPSQGPVLVTGAAGGVGSIAVALLAHAGFTVIAATGRPGEADFLRELGAAEIIDRQMLADEKKPLSKEQWIGAIDVAGGAILAGVLAGTKYGGTVAACGLANGMALNATVAPFILRGVGLLGIDSVMATRTQRERGWARVAADLDRAKLAALALTKRIEDAIDCAPQFLAGQVRGRIVLDLRA